MITAPGPKNTLAEWLVYIESIHPASIDMELTRVKKVGEHLGLLTSWPCPIVTVAGTNGKGTTVKTLSTLLNTLGYSVGAYTSPHLFHFSERIELNLAAVSEAELIQAFCLIEQARLTLSQTLTYFEFTTLAALAIFKNHPLDILILEIGLGGRLDAVNIINPDVSIITSIGYDHMDYLGDTLDKIAVEKAGIIRDLKPVILGEGAYRANILAIAEAKNAPVYVRGRDFDDEAIRGEGAWLNQYFPESVQLAIQALKQVAPKIGLKPETIQHLLDHFPEIGLTGRFQRVKFNQVEWIIDVAHNAHATNWLVENLNYLPSVKTTHIVWCSFLDKELEAILSTISRKLAPELQENMSWYVGPLDHPRTATQEQLKSVNNDLLAGKADLFETFEEALNQAYNQARPNDRVIVFGSFQAANEALAFIKKSEG